METEVELQDSSQPDEENTSPEDSNEEDSQPEEEEVLKKNRQLFERAKKAEDKAKELESEVQRLKDSSEPLEDYEVNQEVKALKEELTSFKEKSEMDKVFQEYPILNQKLEEFDTYRDENKGMNLQTAAKAFLVENDLLGDSPKRKGLEPARGGKKTPPSSSKMSVEDVRNLRENNYVEYKRLLAEGKIQIAD